MFLHNLQLRLWIKLKMLFVIVLFLLLGLGMVILLWHSYHPSVAVPSNPDKVFPVYVITVLPTGLSGLMIAAILAATHIHLDHDNCLEMIAVKGKASEVQRIADALIGTRGVKHGKLTATTTGKKLA